MPLRRFGTFAGGIELPDDKAATLEAAIEPIGHLSRLRVPLAPVSAEPARPVVRPGEYVSHGEPLAEADDGRQADVFAPLAGRVAEFTEVLLHDDHIGWRKSPAVELSGLDEPMRIQHLPIQYEWQAADNPSLRVRLSEGGLVTCGKPPAALNDWLARGRAAGVDTLIANVTENTPFVTADHRLLVECGSDVIRGLAILARALGAPRVMLAVDHRRTDNYRGAVGPARHYGIASLALPHKYPIGAEAMIVKVLIRREIPPGGCAFDVAAAVTDAATCWAVYRWVACGERQTARVVTLAGPEAQRPGNYLVPFGADAGEALSLAGAAPDEPGVCGSAMRGAQIVAGAVTASGTEALLAIRPPAAPPPTACIRCGWCSENCPARLNVAALNDDFELGRPDRARRRFPQACVGCGICSYVCPARLPLARRVALLKQALRSPAGAT